MSTSRFSQTNLTIVDLPDPLLPYTDTNGTTSPCLYPSKNRTRSLALFSLPIIWEGSVKLSRNALFAKSRFSFSTSAEMRLRASLSTSLPLETHIYKYIPSCQVSAHPQGHFWDYRVSA